MIVEQKGEGSRKKGREESEGGGAGGGKDRGRREGRRVRGMGQVEGSVGREEKRGEEKRRKATR